jgi:hypothetical protein
MKKLALTTVCALVMAGAAFAQGTISWSGVLTFSAITGQYNNNISTLFGGPGGGTGTATPTAAGGFYYELLYNTAFTGSAVAKPTSIAALATQWVDTGLEANNSTATAGRLTAMNANTAAVIPSWVGGIGTLGGTTNNIILVGWSANLGTTWAAARTLLQNWDNSVTGAYFGMSNTGYLVPNTGSPGATVFAVAANANGLPIYSLATQLYALPVPEPATFALVGLGALSLLLFRRRQ